MLSKTNNVTIALNDGNWNNLINSKLDFYYTSFFGFLSVSLGFCFTTYLWMSKPNSEKRNVTRKLRFAQTNSIFVFGVIMLVLTRFFTIYMGFNYDGFYLNLKEYFGFLAFLLPLFIFLYNWALISKIYQSKKILLISLLIFGILGLALSGIRT
jgi:vacuolar-type H+-ATPase subunit I/STV1